MSQISGRSATEKKSKPVFRAAFLSPRYWPTWLLIVLLFLINLLPQKMVDAVGIRLGKIAAARNKKRYAIARKNISLCFPDKTPGEIDDMIVKHFGAQIRSMLHYAMIWWATDGQLQKKIEIKGFGQVDECRQQGRNVIVLTCHNVGLEFSVAALTMHFKSSGPYKSMRNPVIDWLVASGRSRFSAKLFTREDGLRPLVRETRSGRVLIYLADEDLGAEKCVFAPFFNVQKATVPVLGRLARTCNADVFLCFSCYDAAAAKYRVQLSPRLENFPHETDEQDALAMNQALESAILECPEQYFWTLRLFQTRPPGEAPVYD